MVRQLQPRVPGLATKAERARARRRLGSLASRVVTPVTFQRYWRACSCFFNYLRLSEVQFPRNLYEYDMVLCQYVEHVWQEGEPKGLVGDLLSGLGHFLPPLKRHMSGAWRLHAAWGKLELPCRAWPLTKRQVCGLAGLMVGWGFPDAAMCVLLGFHCILRTGEITALRWGHITFAPNLSLATISLPFTKGTNRFGIVESVTIEDTQLVRALWRLHGQQLPGNCILRRSAQQFRHLFDAAVKSLAIPGVVKPYSLRRGGATSDFLFFNSLDHTTVRGRWAHVKTARIYINTALAELAQHRESELEKDLIERVLPYLRFL